MRKRVLSFLIVLICTASVPFCARAQEKYTPDDIKNAVEGVISYKSKETNTNSAKDFVSKLYSDGVGFAADWYLISLSRFGYDCVNNEVISSLKSTVNNYYSDGLERTKVTDLQRTALSLLICGEDITDVNGHNLLSDATYNRQNYRPLNAQGVNSLSYALILLDSMHYPIPDGAAANRNSILNAILKYEAKNGGFTLTGTGAPDADITAITLQALAPYKDKEDIKPVIDRAVNYLSNRMDDSGGYKNFYNEITSESTAQVILALTALGINPQTDSRFNKDGNPVQAMLKMQLDSGAFPHTLSASANEIATYQSLEALVALFNYLNGKESFFEFGYYNKTYDKSTDPESTSATEKSSKKKTTHHSSDTKKDIIFTDEENESDSSEVIHDTSSDKNGKTKKKTNSKSKTKSKTLINEKSEPNKTPLKKGITKDSAKISHNSAKISGCDKNSDFFEFISPLIMFAMYVIIYIIKLRRNKK